MEELENLKIYSMKDFGLPEKGRIPWRLVVPLLSLGEGLELPKGMDYTSASGAYNAANKAGEKVIVREIEGHNSCVIKIYAKGNLKRAVSAAKASHGSNGTNGVNGHAHSSGQYSVSSDIPIPALKSGGKEPNLPLRNALHSLKVGQSFEGVRTNQVPTVRKIAKSYGITVTSRKVGKNNFRVWRIK